MRAKRARGSLTHHLELQLSNARAPRLNSLTSANHPAFSVIYPNIEGSQDGAVKARCVTLLLADGYYSLMKNSNWLDASSRHLRLAVRTLAKTPGFTATVVLTL